MSYDTDPDGTRAKAYQRCQEELESGNFQVAQVFATLILEEAVRDLAKRVTNAAGSITAAIGQASRLQPIALGPIALGVIRRLMCDAFLPVDARQAQNHTVRLTSDHRTDQPMSGRQGSGSGIN